MRVALYWAPELDDPLHARASIWLGRDAETGAALAQPDVPGIVEATADPRLYGFHATLKAPFRICRRAITGMVERGNGVILNFGSVASLRGYHGPSYNAAKAGLIGMTMSIAVAYGGQGIRCNIINSGGVHTEIAETSARAYP